jgi:PAS domain S-box-containing protein
VLRSIVVAGVVLAGVKLLLLPFQNSLPTEFLLTLSDCFLAMLIVVAAWQASRRSRGYARVFWMCVGVAALIWTINFGVGAIDLMSGAHKTSLTARWPSLVISSFPFAIALTLPLLVSEDRETPRFSWQQALDVAQFGLIIFSAFLVFFYIPSLHLYSDDQRAHHLMVLHFMRDSFLSGGYLYRGWRSRSPDLRQLHFRMAGYLLAYAIPPILTFYSTKTLHWPQPVVTALSDLPALFLLYTAVTWRQEPEAPPAAEKTRSGSRSFVWTQVLSLLMPVSVIALAWRVPSQYLRVAWTVVATSFLLYAARLFMMQRQQNRTLSSLEAMEEKFSKAFKSSPAAIAITRLSDGKYIDANDRWLEMTKLTREQAIGRTSLELGIVDNPEEREKVLEALRRHRAVRGMGLNFRVEGRVMNTLVSAEVIELGGEPLIIASILDVTEFKNVTQQLQQAQKMELVGSLAGGVAHDFNNLLTIITGYSALALTRELDDELAEEIRQIREASGKAAALTQQLLAFSRRQVLQPRNISLNSVVEPIEKLLQRTIGENIALVTYLAPNLGTVCADPVQMEQVVMNLAINARDAMPQGGKVIFETQNLDLPTNYPEKGFEIPAGRYVMLIITDTGTGIRPELLDRIFEPFFTTKGVGRGTGLGLSTVYGIVKQSGGYIWAYSDLGIGTTFKVCLPRVESQADPTGYVEVTPEELNGTETVLVVDDDPRVCELTANILGRYGYRVMTANSGEDAERRAHECNQEIHLLVTDVVMPGTSGRELAQQLTAERPGLKTLYMSGYPHLVYSSERFAAFREVTLPKPFAPLDLARHARRTLNG